MSFQEKSAWLMTLILGFVSVKYFYLVVSMSNGALELIPPLLPSLIKYTVVLAVLSIIGHIFLAIISPKDANSSLDERERKIFDKAGNWSGYVLGFGVVTALGAYLFTYNGNLMFYLVFASLVASQLAEYILQIIFYRTVMS